jgi:hypothetical protein
VAYVVAKRGQTQKSLVTSVQGAASLGISRIVYYSVGVDACHQLLNLVEHTKAMFQTCMRCCRVYKVDDSELSNPA